jgi:glucosyl-dolichyl phosphate glucuronosyltransferase
LNSDLLIRVIPDTEKKLFHMLERRLQASIIIPTYNRANILPICFESLGKLQMPPDAFEIIIVDNNSSDDTHDICELLSKLYPVLQIRYVFEGKKGVSNARNRGVQEANGEIICFLDDDSPPAPEWLNCILEPFTDPQVGCVGGPSILDYQGQPTPSWLQGDLQGLLSGYGLPFSKPTVVSKWEQLPLSCNMAIRRCIFTDSGYFRTDLDRSGVQVLAAGDTEMANRICKAGWKVIYVPNAPVRHLVPPERLNKSHIYRVGRGLAESHIILTSDPRPTRILRWFASDLRYAFRMGLKLIMALIGRKPTWFDDYMRFWMVALRVPLRLKTIFENRRPLERQDKLG